jgi:tRNA pseudouridine55 synthase
LQVTQYDYPQLTLDIECSGGTYVRTLGRELAERCGTSAVMSALVRMSIGCFSLSNAVDIEALSAESLEQYLLPPTTALAGLPTILLDEAEIARIAKGQSLENRELSAASQCAALDHHGNLIAIMERHEVELRPVRVFASS